MMGASGYFALCAAATLALLLVASAAESGASNSSSASQAGQHKSSTATQQRQSPMSLAAAVIGTLGSLVPSLVSNVAPLVLLFGIGALMMPQFGLSAMGLLRESRRSATDQPLANLAPGGLPPLGPFGQYAVRPLQSSPQDIYYFTKRSLASGSMLASLQELGERVLRAIDNADKRYN